MEGKVILYGNYYFDGTLVAKLLSGNKVKSTVILFRNGEKFATETLTSHYCKFEDVPHSGKYHVRWTHGSVTLKSNFYEIEHVNQTTHRVYPKIEYTKSNLENYLDPEMKYRIEVRLHDVEKFEKKYGRQFPLHSVFKHANKYVKKAFGEYFYLENSQKLSHDELAKWLHKFNGEECVQYAVAYVIGGESVECRKYPKIPVNSHSQTPSFDQLQHYLDPASIGRAGMNVRNAWRRGYTGGGATIRFLEFGLFENHEDLKGAVTVARTNLDRNPDHGSATAGLLVGKANQLGVTGIAHNSKAYYYDHLLLDDIIQDCSPGDIIGIFKQLTVWPADRDEATYLRMKILSEELGCSVLLLIGNGVFDMRWNGGRQNYGQSTIAGCNPSTGERNNTNFWSGPQPNPNPSDGSNSLLNSWSDSVVTCGYGDLYFPNGDVNRSYTQEYSGASSATPLVAATYLQVQGALMSKFKFLHGHQLRDSIRFTGFTDGINSGIGFRPNVDAALNQFV
jgi:hypothetical protein